MMGWSKFGRRLGGALRGLRSCAKGAAAAEFGIIVPVIGVLLTGTVDLFELANRGLTLDAALRAGAGYAMANPTNTTAIKCVIGEAVTCPTGLSRYAPVPTGATLTVTFLNATDTFAPPKYCTFDNDTTTMVSCDNSVSPCAGAQCPKHSYVKIRAVLTGMTPLIPFPIIDLTTVTRTLTVRVS